MVHSSKFTVNSSIDNSYTNINFSTINNKVLLLTVRTVPLARGTVLRTCTWKFSTAAAAALKPRTLPF